MNQPDIDSHIDQDLSLLADETRRGLGAQGGVAAILAGAQSAFRDDRPGAEARRDALLGRRRLELALMPLSLERAFVHRVSRSAAGGVASLCAAAIMVGLSQPGLIRLADLMIPGVATVTLASVAVAVAVLVAYIVGGWVAERVFERGMRESFETSGEPYRDLDALARGPIDRARELARRADGWAIGLTLLAVATLAPLLAFLSLSGILYAMRSVYSLADLAVVVGSTGDLAWLALGMTAGAVVAVAVGRGCEREHRSLERPRAVRWLDHVAVLPLALVAGLALLVPVGDALQATQSHQYVSIGSRLLIAAGGTLAVTAAAAWALLWHRRREQRRLDGARLA
jgi:hypothetical protein